jgi:hypothetical protein
MTDKEALLEALEALHYCEALNRDVDERKMQAITVIRKLWTEHAMRETQRLGQEIEQEPKIGCVNHDCDQCKAQPEQEPDYWFGYGLQAHTEKPFEGATPIYTHPPQRKPLTDEAIAQIAAQGHQRWLEFARAIEAAHDIKE